MEYIIKRGTAVVATVKPEGKQSKKIMDVNTVEMAFTLSAAVDFRIGDYVDVYDERYVLQDEPDYDKNSNNEHVYKMLFKGRSYELGKVAFMQLDGDNELTEGQFDLMADASMVLDLIVRNANRIGSGWLKFTLDATATQLHSFSDNNCLSALSTMTTTLQRMVVDGQITNLSKLRKHPVPFKYGCDGVAHTIRSIILL